MALNISKQEQVFLEKVNEFVDLSVVSDELKQAFVKDPFKLNLSELLADKFPLKADDPENLKRKFKLLFEFKFTIPADYEHEGYLNRFYSKNKDEFKRGEYNPLIVDEKFRHVSHKLIPGKTYTVKIWEVRKKQVAASVEILFLLKTNNAYLTGAHGILALWQEKRDKLFQDRWYASFDEALNLPIYRGSILVPKILYSPSGSKLDVGFFWNNFNDQCYIVSFCDQQKT